MAQCVLIIDPFSTWACHCQSAARERPRLLTSKLPARGKRTDTVGRVASDRLDCQRRVDPADGREHGTITDPQVADIPASTIRVDEAVVGLLPYVTDTGRLQALAHKT